MARPSEALATELPESTDDDGFDVNTASAAELQARVPELGQRLAFWIVRHRARTGPFTDEASFTAVKGVDADTAKRLVAFVKRPETKSGMFSLDGVEREEREALAAASEEGDVLSSVGETSDAPASRSSDEIWGVAADGEPKAEPASAPSDDAPSGGDEPWGVPARDAEAAEADAPPPSSSDWGRSVEMVDEGAGAAEEPPAKAAPLASEPPAVAAAPPPLPRVSEAPAPAPAPASSATPDARAAPEDARVERRRTWKLAAVSVVVSLAAAAAGSTLALKHEVRSVKAPVAEMAVEVAGLQAEQATMRETLAKTRADVDRQSEKLASAAKASAAIGKRVDDLDARQRASEEKHRDLERAQHDFESRQARTNAATSAKIDRVDRRLGERVATLSKALELIDAMNGGAPKTAHADAAAPVVVVTSAAAAKKAAAHLDDARPAKPDAHDHGAHH